MTGDAARYRREDGVDVIPSRPSGRSKRDRDYAGQDSATVTCDPQYAHTLRVQLVAFE